MLNDVKDEMRLCVKKVRVLNPVNLNYNSTASFLTVAPAWSIITKIWCQTITWKITYVFALPKVSTAKFDLLISK